MNGEPRVVQVMREHKALILAQEEATMREMAEAWVRVEMRLEAQMAALVYEAAALARGGQVLSQAQLFQMERYRSLMAQVEMEMRKYTRWADESMTAYQARLAEQGLVHAAEAIRAVYTEAGVIGAHFNVLNAGAVEAMIGLAGDGKPLMNYLKDIYPTSVEGIRGTLVDGVAQGWGAEKLGRELRDSFGMGLQQAMNTARTEGLRAYRSASLMEYRESGVVSRYKRLSAHDERVCAGCLFMDGQEVEGLELFDEHNQGRCTAVPCVEGVEKPEWTAGKEWFEGQSENVQESILGTGRFEAWKDGASLEEMVVRKTDPVWGGAYVAR